VSIGALITPLDPALRTAWLELVVIALLVAPVGVWALHRRTLFAAEVLPHAMLPAAGAAALLGLGLTFGGFVGALVGAGAIALLGRGGSADERDLDSAATTVLGAATGLGTILTIEATGTRGLERLLFGDPLAATAASLAPTFVGAVLVGAGAILGHRALLATTLGPDAARVAGVSAGRVELWSTIALAATVALAAGAVGAVLAFALVVGPAAVVTRGGHRVGAQILASAVVGLVVVTVGLSVSANVDVPAGAAVALAAGLPGLAALAIRH
jgi:ABC-type Mn2+/Zn2+ transport system permease subunit